VALGFLVGGPGPDAITLVQVLCDGVDAGRGRVVLGTAGTGVPTPGTCTIAFEVRERTVPEPLLRLTPLVDVQVVTEGGPIVIRSVTVSREEAPT
jgi:hypothetical protein